MAFNNPDLKNNNIARKNAPHANLWPPPTANERFVYFYKQSY